MNLRIRRHRDRTPSTVNGLPSPAPGMLGYERARWAVTCLSWVGLAALAGVTFVTSFDAVSSVAAERGSVAPHLAWAIPLAIDGMIVVGSAIAWAEALSRRWHVFPLTVVATAGALSIVANVAHAEGADLLGQALAAVPPAGLIASVELAAWQVRRELRRRYALDPAPAPRTPGPPAGRGPSHAVTDPAPRAAGEMTLGDLLPVPAAVAGAPAAGGPAELWPRIADLVAATRRAGEGLLSQREIARRLDVDRGRVVRAVAAHRAEWDHLVRDDLAGVRELRRAG